ncbi:cupin domain-containing protein [Photobacterium sp. CCB-ST2H9]|uniref:cupin domain-containing protein n=1 Tax=unclassified Photobacterium TaxID=2628852 RepID=UPI002003F961|nr:cupin domain-containing protein [Photobacterium sp. CCB-ST2H9]UTM60033.1 cupin domain-containing protein [Photobacterium sp. CCB-ST2H9]
MMTKAKEALTLKGETFNPFPEPFKSRLGQSEYKSLGDPFGLTQFGVDLELLEPNSQSALRHWHTKSDEFIYVLDGELCLVTDDGEQVLTSGMCIGFPAGIDNGHHLINRSNEQAKFIVVGSRVAGDEVHYPDDDFKWVVESTGKKVPSKKNGTPYSFRNKSLNNGLKA